jgi:hypothetical protein
VQRGATDFPKNGTRIDGGRPTGEKADPVLPRPAVIDRFSIGYELSDTRCPGPSILLGCGYDLAHQFIVIASR